MAMCKICHTPIWLSDKPEKFIVDNNHITFCGEKCYKKYKRRQRIRRLFCGKSK